MGVLRSSVIVFIFLVYHSAISQTSYDSNFNGIDPSIRSSSGVIGITTQPEQYWNTELIGKWSTGPCDVVKVHENFLLLKKGCFLEINDITDPANPVYISKVCSGGNILDIDAAGNFVYIVIKEGFEIIDISDVYFPAIVGRIDILYGDLKDVFISGNTVYLADSNNGLLFVDISDPREPVVTETLYTGTRYYGVVAAKDVIFIADIDTGLRVYIRDTNNDLIQCGVIFGEGLAKKLYINDRRLFMVGVDKLFILDITHPSNPVPDCEIDIQWIEDIAFDDQFLYILSFTSLSTAMLTDPENIKTLDFRTTLNLPRYQNRDIDVYKGIAYCGNDVYGLRLLNVENPFSPSFHKFILSGGGFNGIAVNDSFIVLENSSLGLCVFDKKYSSNPKLLGTASTSGFARDINIVGNHVYLVDNYGLHLIDITDPANPLEINSFKYQKNDYPSPQEVIIDGNYAYYVNGPEGVSILDISNPLSLYICSTIYNRQFITIESIDIIDNYIYLLDNHRGLFIYDITDVNNPVFRKHIDIGGLKYKISINRENAFITGDDGILIYNLGDRENPVLAGKYNHKMGNMIIRGNVGFFENWNNGVRILDLSDPANPFECGYFMTINSVDDLAVDRDFIYAVDSFFGLYIVKNDYITTEIIESPDQLPFESRLHQNHPNPFNPVTTIKYCLPENTTVNITIYDILGRKVNELVNGFKPVGTYEIRWNGTNEIGHKVASGIYFYRIKTDRFSKVRRMTLIR